MIKTLNRFEEPEQDQRVTVPEVKTDRKSTTTSVWI